MSLIEEETFVRGKWEGYTIWDIAVEDPDYLDWVLNNVDSLYEEDYDNIREALKDIGHL